MNLSRARSPKIGHHSLPQVVRRKLIITAGVSVAVKSTSASVHRLSVDPMAMDRPSSLSEIRSVITIEGGPAVTISDER